MTLALVRYFAALGTTGFGGPVALAGRMQRDLVDERGWFTSEEFAEGLALAQLAPGPLAAQLAIYLGWLKGGTLGASAVAVAFIAPSFLMVMALSVLYVRYGGMPWMRGAFYGIAAAVIGLIARGAVKLSRSTVGPSALLWALWLLNALIVVVARAEIVWVFALSGAIALLSQQFHSRTLLAVPLGALFQILGFFAKASLVVFGSGLAIVPFLYGGVVGQYHWLTPAQFLDAVAVSMITPGPIVITVAFIGYVAAGPLGGIAAAVGVFLPVYLVVVLAAPQYRRITSNPRVRAFVKGVSAAAAGALSGAVVVLALRAIVDWATVAIAAATLLATIYAKRVPEPVVILLAGALGVLAARSS